MRQQAHQLTSRQLMPHPAYVPAWQADQPQQQHSPAQMGDRARRAGSLPACDLKLEGADATLKGLQGGLDGVYAVSSCESGLPLYKRKDSLANGALLGAACLACCAGRSVAEQLLAVQRAGCCGTPASTGTGTSPTAPLRRCVPLLHAFTLATCNPDVC